MLKISCYSISVFLDFTCIGFKLIFDTAETIKTNQCENRRFDSISEIANHVPNGGILVNIT